MQPLEHQPDTRGMSMPSSDTDSLVPGPSNLCLIWDVDGIRSIGLPSHQQKVTLFVVSTMLALRWIEENVTKYRESRALTVESIHPIDYSRRLELFETACKVVAVPKEVRFRVCQDPVP